MLSFGARGIVLLSKEATFYLDFENYTFCNKMLLQLNIFSFLWDAAKVFHYRCRNMAYLERRGDHTKNIFLD